MDKAFKEIFLNASGYDIGEMHKTGFKELIDGLTYF